MFGSYYVIEHVLAEYNRKIEEDGFRIYVSDLLKILAENWGATVPRRYIELITPQSADEKTGDEVAREVIEKIGLKVTHG